MSNLTFLYKLTEDGRKQAFATTGNMPDAKQTASYDMTQATPEQRTVLAATAGVELKLDWVNGHYNRPFPPTFDAEPTLPELIEALAQFAAAKRAHATEQIVETINEKIKKVQSAIDARQSVLSHSALLSQSDREKAASLIPDGLAEYDAVRAQHAALVSVFAEEEKSQAERTTTAKADADAKADARRKQLIEEKRQWIEAHGSAHLRRACLAEGYDCQRLYVTERAAVEAPGFLVDFDDTSNWKDRSCPSVASLDALDVARKFGLGDPKVVWLTDSPNQREYEDFEPCEAVIIRNYLDKYDLIQVL